MFLKFPVRHLKNKKKALSVHETMSVSLENKL